MSGLLGLLGLLGLTRAAPSISGINSNRFSVNGGFRVRLTGSGFSPAGWELGSAASIPTVLLVNNQNSNIIQPCEVRLSTIVKT